VNIIFTENENAERRNYYKNKQINRQGIPVVEIVCKRENKISCWKG
jgi:hypothetical protein